MEIEIKGLIEFCKAISTSPTEVSKSPELVDALSFCIDSLSKCNCSNKAATEIHENKYVEIADKFSQETIKILAEILDPNKTYSNISITFPHTNKIIKIK